MKMSIIYCISVIYYVALSCGVHSHLLSPPSISGIIIKPGPIKEHFENLDSSTIKVNPGWQIDLNCSTYYPHLWTSTAEYAKPTIAVTPPFRRVGNLFDASTYVYSSHLWFKSQNQSDFSVTCRAVSYSSLTRTLHVTTNDDKKPRTHKAGIISKTSSGGKEKHLTLEGKGGREWQNGNFSLFLWEKEPIMNCISTGPMFLTTATFECLFPNDCQMFLHCLLEDCPGIVMQILHCPEPCQVKTTYIQHRLGVVACLGNGFVAVAFRFTGFDGRQYRSDQAIPDRAVVGIEGPNRQILHAKQPQLFYCRGLKAIVGHEIQWAYINQLGFTVWIRKESYSNANHLDQIKERESFEQIYSGILINVTVEMTGISCLVPYQNSPGFATASLTITVRDVSPPTIDRPKSSAISLIVGKHSSHLFCNSSGEPTPELQWKFKNQLIRMNDSNFRVTTTGSRSMLTLITTDSKLAGQVDCTAVNLYGSDSITFHISISDFIGLNTFWTTVLLLVGVIVVLVVSAAVVIIRWRKSHHVTTKMENLAILTLTRRYPVLTKSQLAEFRPHENFPEIPESDFSLDGPSWLPTVLGKGSFGTVYKGKLKNKEGKKEAVAIKAVKIRAKKGHHKALFGEILICSRIEGRHPHIIELKGAFTSMAECGIMYLFMEYSSTGSLKSFLDRCRQLNNFLDIRDNCRMQYEMCESESELFTTLDLIRWCLQIADGMAFLAAQNVVHGDLAARNIILFHGKMVAKIADFGSAKDLVKTEVEDLSKSEFVKAAYQWIAPSVFLHGRPLSSESDIYAYGCLVFEIFSLGDIPYSVMNLTRREAERGEDFGKKVRAYARGVRTKQIQLPKPKMASNSIYCDVIMKCVQGDEELTNSRTIMNPTDTSESYGEKFRQFRYYFEEKLWIWEEHWRYNIGLRRQPLPLTTLDEQEYFKKKPNERYV